MTANVPTTVGADRPLAGIALYNGGFVFLVAMDALIKLLSESYPTGQLVLCRCVFGLLPIMALIAVTGRPLTVVRPRRPGRLVLRGVVHAVAIGSFFYALGRLPLADAYALAFTAPLFITALSWPMLREPVGLRRWIAVTVGFLGVVVMLRPGGAAAALPLDGVLAALVGAFSYALMGAMTRRLSRDETNEAIVVTSTVTVGLLALASLPFGMVMPAGPGDGLLLVALGLLGGTGFLLLTQAYRLSPVAVLAPFEYTTMVYAVALGLLIWGEVPDPQLMVGAGIVIACGLYILHRERLAARRAAAAGPTARPPVR
jgi:drug/metabolite transporter (DMT)-like permease